MRSLELTVYLDGVTVSDGHVINTHRTCFLKLDFFLLDLKTCFGIMKWNYFIDRKCDIAVNCSMHIQRDIDALFFEQLDIISNVEILWCETTMKSTRCIKKRFLKLELFFLLKMKRILNNEIRAIFHFKKMCAS